MNQARSSSSLLKRACNSRSDHVCQTSVRGRAYDSSRGAENPISCSSCRTRHDENISELRHECRGGDAIDTVPSREYEKFATSGGDKNEFVKFTERDRYDTASRRTDEESSKTAEWTSRSACSTYYYHRKARCSSRPCSSSGVANLAQGASHERCDKIARGDSSEDGSKDSAPPSSRHAASIDLDDNLEEGAVTGDACNRSSRDGLEEAWATKLDVSTPHREILDSVWRYRCELRPHKEAADITRSSCDRCCDRYHHQRRDPGCCHRHCCYHAASSADAKRCEHGGVRRKSWCDSTRGESGRVCARHCHSKDSDIISAVREHEDEEGSENEDDGDDDDDNVGVINHKDSMCILAEKYKADKRCRGGGGRCGEVARSSDRTSKDECDKSLTSEIIDQPKPLESPDAVSRESSKPACRALCGNCGLAFARTCSRECKHEPPEAERLSSPLCETVAARCCSRAAPCRRAL